MADRIKTKRDGRQFVVRGVWPCECERPGTKDGCTSSGWVRCNARWNAKLEAQRSIGRTMSGHPLSPDDDAPPPTQGEGGRQ